MGRDIWKTGVHEVGITEVIWRLLNPGAIAVDGGAHIGYFTTLMATRTERKGQVFAFEPHPDLFRVLEHNVGQLRTHANCANVYFQQNRLDDAVSEYKKALAIRGDFAIVHNNLAMTYLKKGEYELAIKHCDLASELGAVHPKLLKDLLPYRGR